MPRSKRRKGAKPYRPKPMVPTYGADPLSIFLQIGNSKLGEKEEEAACELLLHELSPDNIGNDMRALFTAYDLPCPPTTHDDIRTIARRLVERPTHAPS